MHSRVGWCGARNPAPVRKQVCVLRAHELRKGDGFAGRSCVAVERNDPSIDTLRDGPWCTFWIKVRQMTVKSELIAVGDVVRVSPAAPLDYKGRTGIVTEIGPGDGEYRVEFEDSERPTTGYLPATWLVR